MMDNRLIEYGRMDYPGVIASALLRIVAIRATMSNPVLKGDLERYRNAIMALYIILPPSIRKKVSIDKAKSLDDLDNVVMTIRDHLEKLGLLARKVLEVGSPDVDVYEESP